MVGLDHYWDIVIGNRIRDTQKLLALIRTKLAYILSGPVYTEIHRNNSVATFFCRRSFQSGRINQRGVAQILVVRIIRYYR